MGKLEQKKSKTEKDMSETEIQALSPTPLQIQKYLNVFVLIQAFSPILA